MYSLVIGMGEIGKAVSEVIGKCQTIDREHKPVELPVHVMHVCFPYSDDFCDQVNKYSQLYKPDHIIIYSTVPIGTAKSLNATHSPVEGRHPDLALSIRTMPRWIGANTKEAGQFFWGFFDSIGVSVRIVPNSDFTEMLKLRSTARYGINLIWSDYEHHIANSIEMPFELLKEFDSDYNKLYRELGEDWAQRYILDPPEGKIGGHCVVPNARLLNEQYPNHWLEELSKYGI